MKFLHASEKEAALLISRVGNVSNELGDGDLYIIEVMTMAM